MTSMISVIQHIYSGLIVLALTVSYIFRIVTVSDG